MWWNEDTCRPQIIRMFYGHITRNLGLAGVSALLFWCKFPCELFGMRACLGVGVIYLYVCGGCGWRVMYDSWWGWRTCACEPQLKYCHISWTGNGIKRDFGSILRKIHVYLLYHYSSLANKVVWNCEIVGSGKDDRGSSDSICLITVMPPRSHSRIVHHCAHTCCVCDYSYNTMVVQANIIFNVALQ